MVATLSYNIPAQLQAGDTLQWRRRGGDYLPTDGWTLKYTLISAAEVHSFDATADGEDYAVSVPATDSAGWTPGSYQLTEYVENGAGDRHTLHTQRVTVQPNLAAQTGGLDTRSHARKMLDTIESYMETKDPGSADVQINGRRISYYPVADLLVLRDKYRAAVMAEDRKATGRAPRIVTRL